MILEIKPELAELVGILLGDGSIGEYKSNYKGAIKKQYRIKVTGDMNEDLPYFKEYVSPLMTAVFSKEPLLRFKKEENTAELLLFGKEYYDSLMNLGLQRAPKKDVAVVPKFITSYNLSRFFLRGLFDTDGCLIFDAQHTSRHYYPRLEIKFQPSPMRSQVFDMLVGEGFKPIISVTGSKEVLRIQLNGEKQLSRWVERIGFKNIRHLTKYCLWKKQHYCPTQTTLRQRINLLLPLYIQ
jgi:hypothetical protein